MEQLEQRFAGWGMSKKNKEQETGKKNTQKKKIRQTTFENYHDVRLYESREPRHRVTAEDVDKDFFICQVKAMMAEPNSQYPYRQ